MAILSSMVEELTGKFHAEKKLCAEELEGGKIIYVIIGISVEPDSGGGVFQEVGFNMSAIHSDSSSISKKPLPWHLLNMAICKAKAQLKELGLVT